MTLLRLMWADWRAADPYPSPAPPDRFYNLGSYDVAGPIGDHV